jgi:sec-independent protein translocase protein TatA
MGFPNIGPGELILILIIALIVLGPGKLPDVAASLGRSIREFRKAATDVTEAGKLDAPATSPAAPAATSAQATATEAPTGQGAAPRTGPPPPPVADPAPARQDAGAPARDPNPS